MTTKIFVPSDTTARSLGADAVAAAIAAVAKRRGADVELVRNGSRGLYWLEPLVEVQVGGVRHVPRRWFVDDALQEETVDV